MKTVLLLDQSIIGHKYAFAKLFAKYLLKLGFRVILVLPEKTNQIYEELTESDGVLTRHLYPVSLNVDERSHVGFGKKINSVISCLSLWLRTRRAIKKAESLSKQKVDVVFFSWLDSYLANYVPHYIVDLLFPYKWSGLFFHPWYLFNTDSAQIAISSRDSVLKAKNHIGCGVHDESLQKKLIMRTKKPVVYFPEIADSTPPQTDYELASVIRERSGTKPVVGLIGLEKRKGVLHLLDVIHKDSKKEFFYFIAGEVPYEQYSVSEKGQIGKFIEKIPENVYYHNQPIPEGAQINGVISGFDILFLVYDNFKSSSNFLTKGALFKTLSVGIDSFWIGENIKKYALGLTVDGTNANDTLQACRQVLKKTNRISPEWNEYLKLNGEDQLYNSFNNLLNKKI